jgi:hypothetical protein
LFCIGAERINLIGQKGIKSFWKDTAFCTFLDKKKNFIY